jgi:colanic acid biosynthesis glycosyl transferase WcaI
MKILIYGINFSPELTGIGKYTGEMADWMASQGHEVRVVTAPPYYPAWQVDLPYSASWYQTEVRTLVSSLPTINGLPTPPHQTDTETAFLHIGDAKSLTKSASYRVWRCPLWVPRKLGGLKRLLHLASFALTSFPIMLRQVLWRPDVVWMAAPALMCAPGAWLTARLAGAKAAIHIQDYEVDAAFQLGLLSSPIARSLALRCESALLRSFDLVSTISGRMLHLARSKGVDEGRLLFFPNWVDLAAITPVTDLARWPQAVDTYRQELDIPEDAVVALYSGNMGMKQGLEILPQAAALLASRPDIVFVFCGQGTGKAALDIQCEGLSNVRLLPLQPMSRLGQLLGMADIHLLPQRADAADLVMPSKLTGMLASGRPVIATAQLGTELADVVSSCGLIVPPESPQALADAVVKLASDGALREQLGSSGRRYAELHLDTKVVLRRFEQTLYRMAEAKKR